MVSFQLNMWNISFISCHQAILLNMLIRTCSWNSNRQKTNVRLLSIMRILTSSTWINPGGGNEWFHCIHVEHALDINAFQPMRVFQLIITCHGCKWIQWVQICSHTVNYTIRRITHCFRFHAPCLWAHLYPIWNQSWFTIACGQSRYQWFHACTCRCSNHNAHHNTSCRNNHNDAVHSHCNQCIHEWTSVSTNQSFS